MASPPPPPFTAVESRDVERQVTSLLDPITSFIALPSHPANTFPTLSHHLQTINLLISNYADLSHQIQPEIFSPTLRRLNTARELMVNLEAGGATELEWEREFERTEAGRKALVIAKGSFEDLLNMGWKNRDIAQLLGCSLSTIERRKRKWNLRRRDVKDVLSNHEVQAIVLEAKVGGSSRAGSVAMVGELVARGYGRVPRQQVRDALRAIDPEGSFQREIKTINRRIYHVPFPNSLWHIDGHHKLIRWKIVTHGGIDGKTRLITFIHASDNNRAETVLNYFNAATEEWGYPSRVRVDKGGENLGIKEVMERVRGRGRGSFIQGRSVHNQRIERLWVDAMRWAIADYVDIFNDLEAKRHLSIDSEIHMWCLHLVFLPMLNNKLLDFTNLWNNHQLSSEGYKTPKQLWMQGLIRAMRSGFTFGMYPDGSSLPVDDAPPGSVPDMNDFTGFTDYGIDEMGFGVRKQSDPHVVVPPTPSFLTFSESESFFERLGPLLSTPNISVGAAQFGHAVSICVAIIGDR